MLSRSSTAPAACAFAAIFAGWPIWLTIAR
jgi:hypothetical protein